MERVRRPAVAGSFYPSEATELNRVLRDCFLNHPLGPQGVEWPYPSLLGGVVPHAGYIYSGPCAAHFYSRLEKDVKRVVLLGVDHQGVGARAALSPATYWETPLGKVQVDQDFTEFLRGRLDFLAEDDGSHHQEHSIEVQLPFLQTVLKEFTFLPISLSSLSEEECAQLGHAIAHMCQTEGAPKKKTLLIASSDLNHYLPPRETERLDGMALARLLDLDPKGLLTTVERERISMCGVIPAAVMLFAARQMGAKQARLLKHCHSGDVTPMDDVVGYASVAVEG